MGYRSEVKIVAGKKPAAEIREVIKKYDGSPLTEVGTNDKDETLFVADWAKWYEDDDDFPDVDSVMKVVDKYLCTEERDYDVGIEYCRVGESDNDTDYRSNGAGGGYLSVGIKVHDEGSFKAADEPKKSS